ncbi:hypothetical protein SAMN05216503_2440 [Polaribacter sp. KT25b]|uniref:hypothetical protein n=1 Tax=Polaribacter sp. KT25b TaxID=1855336 RepID=UPI000879E750|nr:hypothetical protein [Polaribacter sp. KT25b]SDS24570.1 hypothetical protein SAMN05216503_2440 [Polaribacter sp. KT25b]
MKTNILSLTIMIFMAGTLLTSCGQASKKDANSVKEDVKELNKDLVKGAKDTNVEIKTAVKANWEQFKTSSDLAIENTEKQIEVLRTKIANANKSEKEKLTKALDKLEQKNKELKEKLAKRGKEFKENMIDFNESAKENEQKFEREFTHDMNELGAALKDLFKNNVQ